MANEARERVVLDVALPYLGTFRDGPSRVREQNDPDHPGQTFDFAGTRPDGRCVAIEVTEALHESFHLDAGSMNDAETRGTAKLQASGVGNGAYALATTIGSPRVNDLWSRIIDAARTLDVGAYVEIARGATLWRFAHPADRAVFNWMPGIGGNVQDMHVGLCFAAIRANTPKLARAAHDGYETALLIVPEWLPHGPGTMTQVCERLHTLELEAVPDTILLVEVDEEDQAVTRVR